MPAAALGPDGLPLPVMIGGVEVPGMSCGWARWVFRLWFFLLLAMQICNTFALHFRIRGSVCSLVLSCFATSVFQCVLCAFSFSPIYLSHSRSCTGAIVGPDGFVVSAETGERLLGPDGNPMLPDGAAPVAAVKEDFSEENAKVCFLFISTITLNTVKRIGFVFLLLFFFFFFLRKWAYVSCFSLFCCLRSSIRTRLSPLFPSPSPSHFLLPIPLFIQARTHFHRETAAPLKQMIQVLQDAVTQGSTPAQEIEAAFAQLCATRKQHDQVCADVLSFL